MSQGGNGSICEGGLGGEGRQEGGGKGGRERE